MPGRGKQKGLLIVRVLQSVKKGDEHMNFSVTNKYWHSWNSVSICFGTAEYCFHFFGAKYKQYYILICDISLGCSKLFDFLWDCSLRKFNFCFNFCKNHIEISQASEKEKKKVQAYWLAMPLQAFNHLNPKSDQHLISPCSNSVELFTKIMRIKEMITNLRSFDLQMNSLCQ